MPTADNESTTVSDSKNASRDALLIELGKRAREIEAQFEAWETGPRDTDDHPEYVEAMEQHSDVLNLMASTPAYTLAGLRAKAERIIYFRKMIGDPDDTHEPDTDGIFGASLARDLLMEG